MSSFGLIVAIVLWIALAFVVGQGAANRGRSYGAFLVLSLLTSPFVGGFCVVVLGYANDKQRPVFAANPTVSAAPAINKPKVSQPLAQGCFTWESSLGEVACATKDNKPVVWELFLAYEPKDTETAKKVTESKAKINGFLESFLSGKNKDELQDEFEIRKQLRDSLNTTVLDGANIKDVRIRS